MTIGFRNVSVAGVVALAMIPVAPEGKTEDLKVQASLGNFVRLCLEITSS